MTDLPPYEIDTELLKLEKLQSSKSGNPNWRFHTTDGLYTTAADLIDSYQLTGKEVGPVTLEMTGDKISGWNLPS